MSCKKNKEASTLTFAVANQLISGKEREKAGGLSESKFKI